MDYKMLGGTCYVRMDRGDEIIATILEVCKREGIRSATFSGIGGCGDAVILVFNPQRGAFDVERVEGMLELVSIMGNVISGDDGTLMPHAHAVFAYREGEQHCIAAGHLDSSTVRYTAEIELRPVAEGFIGAVHDPETGTEFWKFDDRTQES